jgi:hypothetical protein
MRNEMRWSNDAWGSCGVARWSFVGVACSGASIPAKKTRIVMIAMILICVFFMVQFFPLLLLSLKKNIVFVYINLFL